MQGNGASRQDLVDERERALLDQLIAETKLYNTSKAVQELFDFINRLREFGPFNVMLLHIQKPGFTHAATAQDWRERFAVNRRETHGHFSILRAMGPVDFVFDILDTEGNDVPDSAFTFPTLGSLKKDRFYEFVTSIARNKIAISVFDSGDNRAGYIELWKESTSLRGKNSYRLSYNDNHFPPTQFVTIAH